jgi:uncharacterized protein YggE
MKYIISLITLALILPSLFGQELESGHLKITGKAKMLLVPDILTFNFEFTIKDKSSSTAQSTMITETNKLIDRLQKLGYSKNDIKLLAFDVEDDWDYNGEKSKLVGYIAKNEIELSIKYDALKVSQFLDSIRISNYKNLEYSLQLEISESLKNSCREFLIKSAIANAQTSADVISKCSNVSLDGITNIEYRDLVFNFESAEDIPPPPPPPAMYEKAKSSANLRFESLALKELEVYEEVIIIWKLINVR